MKLSDLGEFGLIARIARGAPAGEGVICGIGDDCAVIESGKKGLALLITTDLLVENVHFERRTTGARLLGRKTLAASLSDVAAMGGVPRFFTVNFAAPPDLAVEWVDALYAGFEERAREFGVALVGGDTSSSPGAIFLSVTLLGECPAREVVYRRGAREGDGIFLTGWPGESAAGLALLRAEAAGREAGGPKSGHGIEEQERLKARHLDPEPRLSTGRLLARGRLATAMIDVSDGVVADLGHILESSGLGARVQSAAVPLSPALGGAGGALGLDPLRLALAGGEDYELLFTGAPSLQSAELSRSLGLPVARIGTITPGPGRLEIVDSEGRPAPLAPAGFQHFLP